MSIELYWIITRFIHLLTIYGCFPAITTSYIVMTEIIWLTKPKIFNIGPTTEKVCQLCFKSWKKIEQSTKAKNTQSSRTFHAHHFLLGNKFCMGFLYFYSFSTTTTTKRPDYLHLFKDIHRQKL